MAIETIQIDGRNFYSFACPQCQGSVLVGHNEVNCNIFRHASYIKDGKPIGPHTPKAQCETLVAENKVLGCAKPFWFDGKEVKVCGYL